MKSAFVILKSIIILTGIILMYFASIFYLGSKEQFDNAIANDLYGFFFSRFSFVLIVGLCVYLLSPLLNLFFRNKHGFSKKTIRISALLEMIIILIISILMTVYSLMHCS